MNYVHLDVDEILKETQKAFLLLLESGEEIWVPMSVVADHEDYDEGDTNCVVSVAEWWAEKNGVG